MKGNNFYLMVFQSKNHAIYLNSLLESKGLKIAQLISTPCYIRAGCSYSVKILDKGHLELIKQLAEDTNIKKYKLYYAERINGKRSYRKLD